MQVRRRLLGVLATQPDAHNYYSHPVYVFLGKTAHLTRRANAYRLEQLAGWLSNGRHSALTYPWHELRAPEVVAIRVQLVERYAAGTVNNYLYAVRGVVRESWRAGLIPSDAYSAIADIPGVRNTGPPAGRNVEPDELRRLIQLSRSDGDLSSVRDVGVIAVLYGTGMRRAEVAGITLGDYDPHAVSFRVVGKGNRPRVAYAPEWVKQPVADWLDLRGLAPGALFTSVERGHIDPTYRHLVPDSIWRLVKKRAAQAGLPPLSTHDLRRTYVGEMLDLGVDQPTIARNVGHSTAMVARYDRRGARTQQRAASLLPSPLSHPGSHPGNPDISSR
jgi:integrase